jgi:hypothetical protein
VQKKTRKALEERVQALENQLGMLHLVPKVFFSPDGWDDMGEAQRRALLEAEGIDLDLDKIIRVITVPSKYDADGNLKTDQAVED